LADLEPQVFKDWLAALAEEERPSGRRLSPATIRRAYVDVHAALQDAIDDRVLTAHPMSGVPRPKLNEIAVRVFTAAETQHLFEVAGRRRYVTRVRAVGPARAFSPSCAHAPLVPTL
jgi:hypothetical protein